MAVELVRTYSRQTSARARNEPIPAQESAWLWLQPRSFCEEGHGISLITLIIIIEGLSALKDGMSVLYIG